MVDKDEIKYRLEEAKYYLLVGWDKILELPKMAQVGLGVVVAALVIALVMGLGGNSAKQDTIPNPVQTIKVDNTPAEIPELKFVKRSEALEKLRIIGFYNIDAQQMPGVGDSSVEEVILEQVPAAGTTITKGEKITLRYGSQTLYNNQSAKKPIPDVSKLLLSKAIPLLEKNGFKNINYNLPGGRNPREFVVTASDPAAKTVTSLNTKITLSIAPGMYLELFIDSVKTKYIPYSKFAKIENPKARVLKITLKDKDSNLNSQEKMNDHARLYKIGLEQVSGEKLDQILLINPANDIVGDSDQALRNVTSQGLTIIAARDACEKAAKTNLEKVEIDWEKNRLSEEVGANSIALTVAAIMENKNRVEQNVVIKCDVGGSSDAPEMNSFEAN